jgi:hypothetical protein
MSTDISRIGLLILIAAFFVGTSTTMRGGRQLSDEQRRALAADNPNLPGIAALLATLACALFARNFALYAAAAAIALTGLAAYIMVPRLSRPEWPPAAKRLLIAGNSLIWFGGLGFVLATAGGLR